MFYLQAEGFLELDPDQATRELARCSGVVAEAPRTAPLDAKWKTVLIYTNEERLEAQRSFLETPNSASAAQALRDLGMEDSAIAWVREKGFPIKSYRVRCPANRYVERCLSPGASFKQGDLLFQHGAVIRARCEVPEQAQLLIEAGALAWMRLQFGLGQQLRVIQGRVLRAERGPLPGRVWLLLTTDAGPELASECPTVTVVIEAPKLSCNMHANALVPPRVHVEEPVPVLSGPASRGANLSPEERRKRRLEREAREAEAKADALYKASRPPLITPPGLASYQLDRRTKLKPSDQCRIKHPAAFKREAWQSANVRAIEVDFRELTPSIVADAKIMPWVPHCAWGKDTPDLTHYPGEGPPKVEQTHAVFDIAHRVFAEFSGKMPRVTLHLPETGPVELQTSIVGHKRLSADMTRVGVLWPTGLKGQEQLKRIWVTLTDSTPGPRVPAVPLTAIARPPGHDGTLVSAQVGSGTLAWIPIETGREVGGWVEVTGGIPLRERVTFYGNYDRKQLKAAEMRIEERLRAASFLKRTERYKQLQRSGSSYS
jgi:hypothetical protein